MKHFTIQDIRSWQPCYDPSRYLPEDFKGTALDILCNDAIPIQDRFWVVLHKDIISDKTLRLFAVYCAREALKLVQNPDVRSIHAIDTAERYALGRASDEELAIARSAGWSAAPAAADAAASSAASSAAWSAADAAASSAAWSAARSAAWAAQKDKLIEMIIAKGAQ